MKVTIPPIAIILLSFVHSSTEWIKLHNLNIVKKCEQKSSWNVDSKSDIIGPYNLDKPYATSTLNYNCFNIIPPVKAISELDLLLYVEVVLEESGLEILVFQNFDDKIPVIHHVWKGIHVDQGWNVINVQISTNTIAYIQLLEHFQGNDLVKIDSVKFISHASYNNDNDEPRNFDEYTSHYEDINAYGNEHIDIKNDRQRRSLSNYRNDNTEGFNGHQSIAFIEKRLTMTNTMTSDLRKYVLLDDLLTTDPTSSEYTTDPTSSEYTTDLKISEASTDSPYDNNTTISLPEIPSTEDDANEGISFTVTIIIIVAVIVFIIVMAIGAYCYGKRRAKREITDLTIEDLEPPSTVVIPRVKGVYSMDSISVTK